MTVGGAAESACEEESESDFTVEFDEDDGSGGSLVECELFEEKRRTDEGNRECFRSRHDESNDDDVTRDDDFTVRVACAPRCCCC